MSLGLASGAQLVNSAVPSPSALSTSAWFRFDTLNLSFQSVFTYNDGTNYIGLYFETGGGGKMQLLTLPAGTLNTVLTPVTTGTWYWVGFSVTAATTANGLIAYSSTGLGAISTFQQNFTAPNPTKLILGDEESPTDGQPLNGQLMVKIYNRILSADELANERNKLSPGVGGVWSFPSMLNAGSAVGKDWSGLAHDFTVAGTPTTSRLMPPVPWTGIRAP